MRATRAARMRFGAAVADRSSGKGARALARAVRAARLAVVTAAAVTVAAAGALGGAVPGWAVGAAGAAGAAGGAGTAAFTLEQVAGGPFSTDLTTASQGERVAWVTDLRGERNVWVADGPGFVPRQVTHYHGDDGQPIVSLRLTPDGWTAVYVRGSEVPEGGEAANPAGSAEAPRQQVWAIDIDAGAAGKAEPRLLGDMGCGFEECEDVQISPDGRSAVWSARNHLWLAPVAGGAAPRSLHGLAGDSDQPRWSPDGKQIAFRLIRRDHSFIMVYDVAGQALRYIAPSVDRDQLPRWSPDGRHLAFLRLPAVQTRLPLIPERPQPWSIWVGDPATGTARQVWQSAGTLAGSLPIFAESSFHYGAGDRIVFASEDNPGGHQLPGMIFTHGGPPRQMMLGFHMMYYYFNAYAMNQYLASRGYAVLSVNYRLGIMYGRAFRNPPHAGWRGAAEYNDVLAGSRYLQSLPQVDPKRIGLWGGSYGGYLTALGLARNSDLFAAGVDFHGVHDWSVFLPRWAQPAADAAPDGKEAIQLALSSSPVSAIDTWRSPVLLIHGDDDRNVPFPQTQDLVARLRATQVHFEQLIIPGEIHDFLRWGDWVKAYQASVDFLDRYLKPAPARP